MIRNVIFALISSLILSLLPSSAQKDSSKIEFDFAIRERFELWDGMNAKNYGDKSTDGIGSLTDKILFQRIITGFTLHPSSAFEIAAHLQDSRSFGWSLKNSEYPDLFKVKAKGTKEPYYIMNPNEEFFEIYDMYIEYRKLFNIFDIKLGRQKISYGDNRIFGRGEWGNTGRWTWDAIKISYCFKDNFVNVFGGGTKIHDPEKLSIPFVKTEFLGGGMYAHFEFQQRVTIEPFFVIKMAGSADYARTLDFKRQWTGVRLFNNNFDHFVYDFTVCREFGNENDKRIDAFGVTGKAGYQFQALPSRPMICIRESYASGGISSVSKIKTFDPEYGSRDQYYGRMNITSFSNLDDREIFVLLFPVKEILIELNYHIFYIPMPDDVTLLGTMRLLPGKHHLGDETDIFIQYQPSKKWQFTGVFGWFNPGDLEMINFTKPEDAFWMTFQILFNLN